MRRHTIALLALLAASSASAAHAQSHSALSILTAAQPDLELCAYRSHVSEAGLRAVQLHVAIVPPRALTIEIEGGDRSLDPCVSRLLRRLLAGPFTEEVDTSSSPFSAIELPMDPAPVAPGVVTTDLPALETTPTFNPRRVVPALEATRHGVPLRVALQWLVAAPSRELAGLLCRVVVGRSALTQIGRTLHADDAAWLRTATRGQCGFATLGPPITECYSDADCTMRPSVPTECCPDACGWGHAVLVVTPLCTTAPDVCPTVACAGDAHVCSAVCQAGRCIAREESSSAASSIHGAISTSVAAVDGSPAARTAQVQQMLGARVATLAPCYDRQLRVDPDARGTVVVHAIVPAVGRLAVSLIRTTVAPEVGACLVSRMSTLQSPPGAHQDYEFDITITLDPAHE